MGLFQKRKQDLQTKNLQELHREKTRQLKAERAALDREREQFEQNSDNSIMESELDQIQQSIENIIARNKKRWRRIMIVWVSVIALAVSGSIGYSKYAEFKGNEKLESYKQQLEDELVQYSEDVEIQKQELQLQIEDLTEELKGLK